MHSSITQVMLPSVIVQALGWQFVVTGVEYTTPLIVIAEIISVPLILRTLRQRGLRSLGLNGDATPSPQGTLVSATRRPLWQRTWPPSLIVALSGILIAAVIYPSTGFDLVPYLLGSLVFVCIWTLMLVGPPWLLVYFYERGFSPQVDGPA